MEDLAALTGDELQAELTKAEADLEDVEEMRLFTLSQTGVHLGASRMKGLQNTWDRDEARLRERIRVITALLDHVA